MSTIRLLPLAAPIAAGVAIAGGAAIVLSILGVLVMLFVARTALRRIENAGPTDPPPAS